MKQGSTNLIGRLRDRWQRVVHRERPHLSLGRTGERIAERYLRRKGLRTVSRNVRLKGGEIDLICETPDHTIVFVEVKTRRSDAYRAELAINAAKRRRLIQLAQRLAKRRRWTNRKLRIDIVAVVKPKRGRTVIRHHPNAVTL